jgi:hypothetical protein
MSYLDDIIEKYSKKIIVACVVLFLIGVAVMLYGNSLPKSEQENYVRGGGAAAVIGIIGAFAISIKIK